MRQGLCVRRIPSSKTTALQILEDESITRLAREMSIMQALFGIMNEKAESSQQRENAPWQRQHHIA